MMSKEEFVAFKNSSHEYIRRTSFFQFALRQGFGQGLPAACVVSYREKDSAVLAGVLGRQDVTRNEKGKAGVVSWIDVFLQCLNIPPFKKKTPLNQLRH